MSGPLACSYPCSFRTQGPSSDSLLVQLERIARWEGIAAAIAGMGMHMVPALALSAVEHGAPFNVDSLEHLRPEDSDAYIALRDGGCFAPKSSMTILAVMVEKGVMVDNNDGSTTASKRGQRQPWVSGSGTGVG